MGKSPPAGVLDALRRFLGYQPPGEPPFRLTFSAEAQPSKEKAKTPEVASQRPESAPDYAPWVTILPPHLRVPVAALEDNLAALGLLFHLPLNRDPIIRRFSLCLTPPVKSAAVYIEGLCDKNLQDLAILGPLMTRAVEVNCGLSRDYCALVEDRLLPANQVTKTTDWFEVIEGLTNGQTAVFVDRCPAVLLVDAKGWDRRAVETPKTETILRGPQDAFNETLRSNTALIRRRLRSPHLVTELLTVGQLTATVCALMYMEGLANPVLVAEVKRRINGLSTDYVADSGTLEQLIEDNYWLPFPTLLATERPDRVASMLAEGRVAILLDGDPFVLVAPINLFTQLHSAEDTSLRWPFGNLLRAVRLTAVLITLLLPGLYLALITFHQEMIPTDLLFAIAGARERVPFPSIVELLVMEIAFELIREAGTRVPGVIGQTIGIVGGLILGQAAVSADIVSPITVVIVALSGLGSFSIPSHSFGLAVRIGRFLYIILGATHGFLGIAAGLILTALIMAGINSFGVPYLAPVAPHVEGSPDSLYREPAWNQEIRPTYLEPLSDIRQPKKSRHWRRGGKGS